MSTILPNPEECIHPAHFFRLMELQREGIPDMLMQNYIPIFLVNLIRDKICPDTPGNSTGSSGSIGYKRAKLDLDGGGDSVQESNAINNWTQETLLENVADFEGMYFLSMGVGRFVERVLFFAHEMKHTNGIGLNSAEFIRLFSIEVEFPCLELLWLLDHKFRLMAVSTYLMKLNSKPQLDYFQNQFISFCFSPCLLDAKTRGKSTEMLHDFLKAILIAGYCNPESNSHLIKLKELAIETLVKIRQRLYTISILSSSYQNLHLLIAVFRTVPVVASIKQKYFADELCRILMLEPHLSVRDIIQQQEKLAEHGIADTSLAETIALFTGEPQAKKDVISTMEKCLESLDSINWENLLFTITVWDERSFGSTRIMNLLKATVQRLMVSGLVNEKGSDLLAAFIIGRHCCLIAPQRFARYEEWFTSLFQNEETTCAGTVKPFSFLLKTWTEYLEIEPACFLQVHATYPPYIPVGCDDLWKEYLAAVKTRVSEYIEVEEAMEYEPNPDNPLQYEVEIAIKTYDKLKKIPNKVHEMFMFRRDYYLESFLPTLIRKPLATAQTDARLRLIEALNVIGKIPHELYDEYKSKK